MALFTVGAHVLLIGIRNAGNERFRRQLRRFRISRQAPADRILGDPAQSQLAVNITSFTVANVSPTFDYGQDVDAALEFVTEPGRVVGPTRAHHVVRRSITRQLS